MPLKILEDIEAFESTLADRVAIFYGDMMSKHFVQLELFESLLKLQFAEHRAVKSNENELFAKKEHVV